MMTIISHLGHVPAHQGIAVGAEVMGIPDEKKIIILGILKKYQC